MFGLLLKGTLFPRTFKNRPIWSHCSFRNYKSTFFHLQRMEQGNLRGGQFSIKTHHPVWKGFWLPRCSFLTKCVFFKKWTNPCLFLFFSFFSNTNFTEKTVGFSGIREEGEHADHLTTTTAPKKHTCLERLLITYLCTYLIGIWLQVSCRQLILRLVIVCSTCEM